MGAVAHGKRASDLRMCQFLSRVKTRLAFSVHKLRILLLFFFDTGVSAQSYPPFQLFRDVVVTTSFIVRGSPGDKN